MREPQAQPVALDGGFARHGSDLGLRVGGPQLWARGPSGGGVARALASPPHLHGRRLDESCWFVVTAAPAARRSCLLVWVSRFARTTMPVRNAGKSVSSKQHRQENNPGAGGQFLKAWVRWNAKRLIYDYFLFAEEGGIFLGHATPYIGSVLM